MTFSDENKIFCIAYVKVRWRNLDYAKNLQVKYFTGENIPIYGIITENTHVHNCMCLVESTIDRDIFAG